MSTFTRRSVTVLAFGGLASGLTACAGLTDLSSTGGSAEDPRTRPRLARSSRYDKIYASIGGEQFPIPAFDYTGMERGSLRTQVDFASNEPAGTIVIEPQNHALYYLEGDGRATRYGVGVGRDGFRWNGVASVNYRKAWPDWIPPREMIERDPTVAAQLTDTPRGRGVPAGPKNPLGARAMVLAANGQDTGYRIHGTWEPDTIGGNVSSGCIRMINQDIVHLYGRTVQTNRVIVMA